MWMNCSHERYELSPSHFFEPSIALLTHLLCSYAFLKALQAALLVSVDNPWTELASRKRNCYKLHWVPWLWKRLREWWSIAVSIFQRILTSTSQTVRGAGKIEGDTEMEAHEVKKIVDCRQTIAGDWWCPVPHHLTSPSLRPSLSLSQPSRKIVLAFVEISWDTQARDCIQSGVDRGNGKARWTVIIRVSCFLLLLSC